jgi:hypothetical protein
MLDFYKEPALDFYTSDAEDELAECATALFSLVQNHTSHAVGPFTVGSRPNKQTLSGVFAAQLQHLFSGFMFPEQHHVPDILVATGQKLKSGSFDTTIYKKHG